MELFNNKTILITGATGLIGFNLARRIFQESNAKIIVTGRNIQKLEKTFKDYLNDDRLLVVEHDASTPLPQSINMVDYIFHAAGPIERDVIMNKPLDVICPNILGTINCLDFLKRQEKKSGLRGRMVVFSSVTVYNNTTNEEYVAVEEDTTHAISLDQPYASYAESKRMIEVISKAYQRQYNIDVVIARFSTVYGFTPNVPNSAFYEFIGNAVAEKSISLNSSGLPRRDNIYVDDAVDGLITISKNGVSGEAYNISSNGEQGNYIAVDEIAMIIANEVSSVMNKPAIAVDIKTKRNDRMPGTKLDNTKLKALGWELKTDFSKGVRNTLKLLYDI